MAEEPTNPAEGEPTGEPAGEPTPTPQGEPTGEPTGEPKKAPEGEPSDEGDGEPTPLGKKPKEEAPKREAPEKYDFTLPEGMQVNEPLLEKATTLFKELNVPQDEAQKFVDFFAQAEKARAEEYQGMITGWTDTAKEELGDEYDNCVTLANKVIDKFGSDGAREIFDFTGTGAHGEIIKLLSNIGKAMSEDSLVPGERTNQPVGEEAQARKMFPNTNFDN